MSQFLTYNQVKRNESLTPKALLFFWNGGEVKCDDAQTHPIAIKKHGLKLPRFWRRFSNPFLSISKHKSQEKFLDIGLASS